jgi:cytochrome b
VFMATMVLFLLPCSLLWAAWRRSVRNASESRAPTWRAHCGAAALVLAACSTLLELVFYYSWFHNGGSPHGMMPSPGVWKIVGRIAFWILVASVVISAFVKGRWRLLILAWAGALVFVAYATFMLNRD